MDNDKSKDKDKADRFRFVVSDESVNSYGCIVQTSGIDTVSFEKNPVMLYMHDRGRVIGRWENIHKENGRLIAEAVFDTSCDLGREVAAKVSGGFLRATSIGIEIKDTRKINGIDTITACELYEISIVDIPANKNAVKMSKNGKILSLGYFMGNDATDASATLKTRLIEMLGLSPAASDEDILGIVSRLIDGKADNEVKHALSMGMISPEEKKVLASLARKDVASFNTLIESRRKQYVEYVQKAVDEAIKQRRILGGATFVFHQNR